MQEQQQKIAADVSKTMGNKIPQSFSRSLKKCREDCNKRHHAAKLNDLLFISSMMGLLAATHFLYKDELFLGVSLLLMSLGTLFLALARSYM